MATDSLERAKATASQLSAQLWLLLKNADLDEAAIMNVADPVENARSLLLGLSEAEKFTQWIVAASDILEELRDVFTEWQTQGNLAAFLQTGSTSRALLDERSSKLQKHNNKLNEALKSDQPNREAALAALSNVEHLMDNTEASRFWLGNFGSNAYQVSLNEFKKKLGEEFPGLPDQAWAQVKSSVDPTETGVVTVHKWSAFLESFGPTITGALGRLGRTLTQDYFAGFLTRDETVHVLRDCAPGAYLVRFSSRTPSNLVLARKRDGTGGGDDADVVQTTITARRGSYELEGRTFHSLQEVVGSLSAECRFAAPTVKSIARAKFFKGFMSWKESDTLLENQPYGTFLFRFSESEAGVLVVARKSTHKVLQTKVVPKNGGYEVLGRPGEWYGCIEEIVHKNPEILRFPYGCSAFETPLFAGQANNYAAEYDRYGGVDYTSSISMRDESAVYGTVDRVM